MTNKNESEIREDDGTLVITIDDAPAGMGVYSRHTEYFEE